MGNSIYTYNGLMPITKRIILSLFITTVFSCFTAFAQKEAVENLQQYQAPTLSTDNAWSMILLPDPQSYNKFGRNQPIFELMTAWVSENINPLNINMVLCTGDLVEQNEYINPDGVSGNQPSKLQWESVARA